VIFTLEFAHRGSVRRNVALPKLPLGRLGMIQVFQALFTATVVIKTALHLIGFFHPRELNPLEVSETLIQMLQKRGSEILIGSPHVGNIGFPLGQLEYAEQAFRDL